MSNFLTIATVTAALQHTLSEALNDVKGGAAVTTARPDNQGGNQPKIGANIYLYQVTPNAAWRNNDLPARNSNGDPVQRPRAALDLHYLISCYGDDAKLEPQRVLGCVVRSLHERPLLARKKIIEAMNTRDYLRDSNLPDEMESVRFTPAALTLEELSKLWSVFFQTAYALSVAYQASVVFIDGEETPRTTLPVREPKVYVKPFRQPVVEGIESSAGAKLPIVSDSTLVVRGKQLRGEVTQILITGEKMPLSPKDVANDQISLPVPAELMSGVQTVQVLQQVEIGEPPTAHRGVESNVAVFVLHPTITVAITGIKSKTKGGVRSFSATISVRFRPKVGKLQRVTLLLNEMSDAPDTQSAPGYSFPAPEDNGITDSNKTETASVDFPISDVMEGDYLVRVQVDGAESQLRSDAKGRYNSPKVTIA